VKVSVKVPWLTFLFAFKVTVDFAGVPCRLSTEGEIEQVEFCGAPEQLRLTEPVSPATGVTVIVYTAWCPEEIVSEAGVAVIVKSPPFTVNEPVAELAM